MTMALPALRLLQTVIELSLVDNGLKIFNRVVEDFQITDTLKNIQGICDTLNDVLVSKSIKLVAIPKKVQEKAYTLNFIEG